MEYADRPDVLERLAKRALEDSRMEDGVEDGDGGGEQRQNGGAARGRGRGGGAGRGRGRGGGPASGSSTSAVPEAADERPTKRGKVDQS